MDENDGEILTRLARLEERQNTHHQEFLRTRRRLHSLEGAVRGLVTLQREKVRDERRRDKKTDRRFRLLTVVVSIAGIVIPLTDLYLRMRHGGS